LGEMKKEAVSRKHYKKQENGPLAGGKRPKSREETPKEGSGSA
jgi:hypothetical protein